jgi:Cu/Zn superoxide dismutase
MSGLLRPGTAAVALALALAAGSAAPALAGTPKVTPDPATSIAQVFTGPLTDLITTTPGPLDNATAQLIVVSPPGTGSTRFILTVTGIDPAVAGTTYGAHLHVGPCVEGNGAAAGPHYNTGGTASPTTEVWLDFTVTAGGTGVAVTTVPFVPAPGDLSVVIHQEPTSPTGTAGARQACLSVPLS